MKFIDEVKISVKSGHGGPGAVSFRRETFVPRGGPDGGHGGRGGNVIIVVNKQLGTLADFRFKKKYFAGDGTPGAKQNMFGPDGADAIIEVPEGTLVKSESGELIADLNDENPRIELLKGGRGGKGNAFFKTSVNQAPKYAQPGEPGAAMELCLELKLIADIGIIGKPNAGKSTLISRISAARPKIADYPFTTLVPNLGVVDAGAQRSFVVADIPGLIEGAHLGAGLGIKFLKHIERTKFFVHLVDGSGLAGNDPVKDFEEINHELNEYDAINEEALNGSLRERQQIVVLNKCDLVDDVKVNNLKKQFKKYGVDVHMASAVTGEGINKLVNEMARRLGETKTYN